MLTNKKGFTLIELMIVIAIIGILAAIAIPNFISYRDKSYCSRAESDANNVAATIADWSAIPTNTIIPNTTASTTYLGFTASGENTITVDADTGTGVITITVLDGSSRCPNKYRDAMSSTANPASYWDGFDYVKVMGN
jgi:type IV pilus assembly protein PilA